MKSKYKLSRFELAFCIACFLFYFAWAAAKPFNYAPDEAMRYDVTRFLFFNNRLPVGDELLSHWGFSYAHLPTVLCNQLGYIFTKLASLFTSDEFRILLSARMVSVCCGAGSVFFVLKAGKRMLTPPGKWIFAVLIAFMPQFAFLSSYVNNDIVAFFGITMILYAWVLGMQDMWNFKNTTLLGIGVSVCALSYYNSYAWILFSIFFFFAVYLFQKDTDSKRIRLLTAYIVVLVFCLIGYSFIRHLVLYGDLLGFNVTHYYGERFAEDYLKPSNRITPAKQGVSVFTMLFSPEYSWLRTTWRSFIGCFSYMSVWCGSKVYLTITIFLALGCIGAVVRFIIYLRKGQKCKTLSVFYLFMIACAIITICLSIYNSLAEDFQPQGRYIYPAFPTLALFVAEGWEEFLGFIKDEKHHYAVCAMICTSFIALSLYVYLTVYLPS